MFHHIPRLLATQHGNRLAQLSIRMCCGQRRDPARVQLCSRGHLQCHRTQLQQAGSRHLAPNKSSSVARSWPCLLHATGANPAAEQRLTTSAFASRVLRVVTKGTHRVRVKKRQHTQIMEPDLGPGDPNFHPDPTSGLSCATRSLSPSWFVHVALYSHLNWTDLPISSPFWLQENSWQPTSEVCFFFQKSLHTLFQMLCFSFSHNIHYD